MILQSNGIQLLGKSVLSYIFNNIDQLTGECWTFHMVSHYFIHGC